MKIAMIGCGTMGKGIAQRLSSSHTIFLYDRNIEKTKKIEQEGHGIACLEFSESVKSADIVILAVKPSSLNEISDLMSRSVASSQMLISLLTGTSIALIKERFPRHRVVRMMPNLALLCGEAIVGLAVDQSLTVKESEQLVEIVKPLGKIYW